MAICVSPGSFGFTFTFPFGQYLVSVVAATAFEVVGEDIGKGRMLTVFLTLLPALLLPYRLWIPLLETYADM